MEYLLFRNFLILIATGVTFYLIGTILLKLLGKRIEYNFESIFFSCMAGLVATLIIYSTWKTGGKTINLIFCIPILFSIRYLKTQLPPPEGASIKETGTKLALFILGLATIIFVWQSYFLYSENYPFPILPHGDVVYGSGVADFLRVAGKENFMQDYIFLNSNSAMPYHYFELWTTSLLSELCNIPTILIFQLVTFNFFRLLTCIGLLAIIENIGLKINIWRFMLAITFIFITGLNFPAYENISILKGISIFSLNPMSYSKLSPIYLFVAMTLLFWVKWNFKMALYSILCIPLVSISTAPSIFMGLALFFIVNLKLNLIPVYRHWFNFAQILLVAAAIGIFYKIFGSSNNVIAPPGISEIILDFLNPAFLKTCINILGGTLIRLSVLYIPFLLVLSTYFWKKDKIKIPNLKGLFIKYSNRYSIASTVLLLLLLGSSICSWAIFHKMVDSVQLCANIATSLINLSLFTTIAFQLKKLTEQQKKSTLLKTMIIFSFIFSSYFSFIDLGIIKSFQIENNPASYLAEVKRNISGINPIGAFVFHSSDYTTIFTKTPNFNVPGAYLSFMLPYKSLVSLSVFETPLSEDKRFNKLETNMIASSTFYKYVSLQKEKNSFNSIPQSKLSFLQEFKIDYLIASKNAKTNFLSSDQIKKIIINPVTGERFILLNLSKFK